MKPFSQPYTTFTDRFRGRGDSALYIEYGVTVACGLGNMLFGYDQGVFGGLLDDPSFEARFPSISNGDATLQGFTTAVYEIGCAAGALSVLLAGDRLGRRITVLIGQVILCVGAVLQFMSYSLAQLIVGRIVTGIGNGMSTSVLPMWNGETSRDNTRGRAVMIQLSINIFGIMIAYWIDYALYASPATGNNEWSWRFPLSLQVLWAALTIAVVFFLPESPRALMRANKIAEARDVIDMLSTKADPKERDLEVDEKLGMITAALRDEATTASGSWLDCFRQTKERYLQRTLLATFSFCMLQLSGINLITYYAPVIFQNTLGMSHNLSLLVTGVNGVVYWLATLIPIPLVDRVGRRPLMLFSAATQSVTMAVLAATIAFPDSTAAGYAAAVFLFVFVVVYSVGFNGMPFLLPMELTPLQTRGKSVAIATCCFWLCNFFVVMISPVLIDRITYGTYILWAGTSFVFFPMIYFLTPETANAALEDIDVLFEQEQRWIIGPTSKRKLAEIVRLRKEAQAAARMDGVHPGHTGEGADKPSVAHIQ